MVAPQAELYPREDEHIHHFASVESVGLPKKRPLCPHFLVTRESGKMAVVVAGLRLPQDIGVTMYIM